MIFKFQAGQTQAGPFFSNRTDASIELISSETLSAKVIESGVLKKGGDAPESLLDARVSNVRVPAGHWLMLSRTSAPQELEVRLRRIQDDSGALVSPTQIVADDAFVVSSGIKFTIVKNELLRSMNYRLVVRMNNVDSDGVFYVESGSDMIYPPSSSFILDTVLPSGGVLAIHGAKMEAAAGVYELFGDA